VLDVEPRVAAEGKTGNVTVDAWLRAGQARLRDETQRLRASERRVWVTVDLLDAPAASPP
jgi:hypothetical protein